MTSDPLHERLRDWISSQGYNFELSVAEMFEEAGFDVGISEFVQASEQDAAREIDVVAREVSLLTPASTLELIFAVECKHSVDKPWVVFHSRKSKPLARTMTYVSRFASDVANVALLELAASEEAEKTGLFSLPTRLGHGVRRAFEKHADAAYEAVTKICDAAAALVSAPKTKVVLTSVIVFPVIVIKGRLFESSLDDSGNVTLDEVTRSTLYWKRPTIKTTRVPIDIVTDVGLSQYVTEKHKQCELMRPIIEKGIPKASGLSLFED